ncbi:MAG: hypothetical protein PWQ87_579 [Candidatus Woesearchaeota archaeon]|nr:hypothetical protein [Candidatus Woesearchaeota archaeon]
MAEEYKNKEDDAYRFKEQVKSIKELYNDERIKDSLDYINERINEMERVKIDAFKEIGGLSAFNDISKKLYSAIEDMKQNGLEVPEEINQLYHDALEVSTKYKKENMDLKVKNSREAIEKGDFPYATAVLEGEIKDLEVNSRFYKGLKPTKECIETLVEALSKEVAYLKDKGIKDSSRIASLEEEIKKYSSVHYN